MATPTNHYKLGLFVIVALSAAIAAAGLFGAAQFHKDTICYHSYFNESVEGLDVGSPVKFRGVKIGSVSAIEIAPDHRMVNVVSDLETSEVKRIGLAESGKEERGEKFAIPPDLRVQLASQGISGVKFVTIDFFDVKSNPLPILHFSVPTDHYIPAAASMMKNLEATITQAMDRLPEMVDAVVMIMGRVDRLFATLEAQDVSGKTVVTLAHINAVMMTLQRTLGRVDQQDLGGKAAVTITDLSVAINKVNRVLDRLDGKGGLLTSAQHATDAFADMGRAGRGTQRDLETTLRDVSEAAEAIRSLFDALEQDPDMLLKGKTKRSVER